MKFVSRRRLIHERERRGMDYIYRYHVLILNPAGPLERYHRGRLFLQQRLAGLYNCEGNILALQLDGLIPVPCHGEV